MPGSGCRAAKAPSGWLLLLEVGPCPLWRLRPAVQSHQAGKPCRHVQEEVGDLGIADATSLSRVCLAVMLVLKIRAMLVQAACVQPG